MLPFMGETMTCCMCGREAISDPEVESNWRAIDVDGKRYYVCPKHFPADDASVDAFSEAYLEIFRSILKR